MSKELDEAAEKNSQIMQVVKSGSRPSERSEWLYKAKDVAQWEVEAFKAGATWAEKNSPRALALVEAIEQMNKKAQSIGSRFNPIASIGRAALEAWASAPSVLIPKE